MSRGGSERIIRLAHRWFGMGALGFLQLSVVTGLLWADAKFLYWDDHYKEKVRPLAGPALETATLSVDRAIVVAKEAVGGRAAVRVRFDDADATEIVLDRQTGEILEDEGRWRRVHFAVMQLY